MNYAVLKEEEEKGLDDIGKSHREIIFHLNRIAPENLKDIVRDLAPFAKEDFNRCEVLTNLIIEKSWEQPKYAASYAKLCSVFTKIDEKDFKFEVENLKKDKKSNPFKHLLVEKVQHSFDKQEKNIPEFENKFAEESYLREIKKNMIGNVKFIGELIKSKVIRKKTIKYCVQNLMLTFLQEHYLFVTKQ